MKRRINKKIILTLVLILIFLFTGCSQNKEVKREKNIVSYDIVSIERYIHETTNQFGGNKKQKIVYYFLYKDSEGNLQEWKDYEENNYNSIEIGKEDKISFNPNDIYDGNTILYLTEKTLKKL